MSPTVLTDFVSVGADIYCQLSPGDVKLDWGHQRQGRVITSFQRTWWQRFPSLCHSDKYILLATNQREHKYKQLCSTVSHAGIQTDINRGRTGSRFKTFFGTLIMRDVLNARNVIRNIYIYNVFHIICFWLKLGAVPGIKSQSTCLMLWK